MEGVFDATYLPELEVRSEAFIRKMAQNVFEMEIRHNEARRGSRPVPTPLLSCFLDALPHALARDQPEQAKKAQSLVALIIEDAISMKTKLDARLQDIFHILHQIANRFSTLCLDDSWTRKSAGANGIRLMINTPELGVKWIAEREVDTVRTLLHILKDLPRDLPRDVDDVVNILIDVLRVSNTGLDFHTESAVPARNKLIHLVGLFFPELQSSNPVVRQAAQTCIGLLVSLSGRPAVDLLMPHRDRMLVGIYTKPLRALPFLKQIGMIEAIRYCVSLDPPLVELNDELLRLLHETLLFADADDVILPGRTTARQSSIEVVKRRVACIKLLTASMPLTDFFQRQHQTRQRYILSLTQSYFPNSFVIESQVSTSNRCTRRLLRSKMSLTRV